MGADTPKSLQNAAFYIFGKMFLLHGGVEHRSLKLSQVIRMLNPDQYVYHENGACRSKCSLVCFCSCGERYFEEKISPNVRTSKNQGNKTNHSLRATGVTELYESGIPEVIQDLGVN